MKLAYTRAMIDAMLEGRLDDVPTHADPVFGLQIPAHVPHVPPEVLDPRNTWPDPQAYDAQAEKLATMFREAFDKFSADVTPEVAAAGPR
jgi:phosphoenolpyruvate carboxykinase (ATP)